MPKVVVYPKVKNALNIKHPADGPLSVGGSSWEYDGFTMRMMTDGEVTTDKEAGWQPKEEEAKPAGEEEAKPAG